MDALWDFFRTSIIAEIDDVWIKRQNYYKGGDIQYPNELCIISVVLHFLPPLYISILSLYHLLIHGFYIVF